MLQEARNWFHALFGFDETATAVYQNIVPTYTNDGVTLSSKANDKSYNAGHFSVRSLNSFHNEPRGSGVFNIYIGRGSQTTPFSMVDSLSCQSRPENDGATYMAASNFNCLELVGCRQPPSAGVTNYVYDRTQGPYVALGCGPAAVFRNYFVKHGNECVGQLENQINLLESTPITLENGYAIIPSFEVDRLKSIDFDWSNLDNYRVGVHRNCQVTLNRHSLYDFELTEGNQIAHHVYAAAFNYHGNVQSCPFTKEISGYLLEGEYKATIQAAWENSVLFPDRAGSRKLYLTLIGGGVFANKLTDISGVIKKCQDMIVESGLDVTLVCFTSNIYDHIKKDLEPMVTSTGGKVTRF